MHNCEASFCRHSRWQNSLRPSLDDYVIVRQSPNDKTSFVIYKR